MRALFAYFLILVMITFLFRNTHGAGIAIYWGQGEEEGTLADVCATGNYQIVIVAFLSTFGSGRKPELNLAGHCNPSSGDCATLSFDITTCQSLGINILLSIGGGTGNYSLSSENDASRVAEYLWDNFLGGQSDSRPLGDAILDGVDFDVEIGLDRYWTDLAAELRGFGRNLLLSAAPQCPLPDLNLDASISSGVFDYLWIQFYNNPSCQYADARADSLISSWKRWNSVPSNLIFLGLAAAKEAAPFGGYIPPAVLVSEILPSVQASPKYGGIMLWNTFNSHNYSSAIINYINQTEGTNQTRRRGSRSNVVKIGIVLSAIVCGVLLACLVCFLYHDKLSLGFIFRRKTEGDQNLEAALVKEYGSLRLKRYSYLDIEKMTESFRDELAQGDYGSVYKGKLPDDRLVTVKIMDAAEENGQEFINEVLSFSRTSSGTNIMLLGFCLEGKRRALVYEYMFNDSLEEPQSWQDK